MVEKSLGPTHQGRQGNRKRVGLRSHLLISLQGKCIEQELCGSFNVFLSGGKFVLGKVCEKEKALISFS